MMERAQVVNMQGMKPYPEGHTSWLRAPGSPPGVIRVDRRTKWGNRSILGAKGYREQILIAIQRGKVTLKELAELHGKTLGCWCVGRYGWCHAMELALMAEAAWEIKQRRIAPPGGVSYVLRVHLKNKPYTDGGV